MESAAAMECIRQRQRDDLQSATAESATRETESSKGELRTTEVR